MTIQFDTGSFDFINCSRVLHFADSSDEFIEIMGELARVLSPRGLLYLSMDSMIGFEQKVKKIDEFKHQFPDGTIRFMLTEDRLGEIEKEWNHVIEPRTIIFNGQHAETTLVLQKS